MNKKYQLSLFIFRRDLRIQDNTGLIKALEQSRQVLACFIFDPRQVGTTNGYRSFHAMQFMAESLQDLDISLHKKNGRLYLFSGEPTDIVQELIKSVSVQAIFINKDYTPFSKERDRAIEKTCTKNNVHFYSFDDLLLNEPETILNKQDKPYLIFTPFYKAAIAHTIDKPKTNRFDNYFVQPISFEEPTLYKQLLSVLDTDLYYHGGRLRARQITAQFDQFANYNRDHNFPAINTTGLSAHNKFGTFSIREIYYAILTKLGPKTELIRQLYWRDFFTYIGHHFPHVFGNPFHEKFKALNWSHNRDIFHRWSYGLTGFPIVDAGMRQLNQTGFMHNRVRLIVGSFLVKDLHINWQWGEKYFAQQLTDYDPCVNNGNWQWVASTGCDAQPYFRIFNPWLQQKKFDPNCEYIKTWIPELKSIPVNTIHTWWQQKNGLANYPLTMIDHQKEASIAKSLYQKLASK